MKVGRIRLKNRIKRGMIALALIIGVGIGINGQIVRAAEGTDDSIETNVTLQMENWNYMYNERTDGSIEVIIVEYTGEYPDPIVPGTINGYPVTTITNRAFFQCTILEQVELPRSVVQIDQEAFSGCENLTSVSIAFDGADPVLEEGVEYSIEVNAFAGCTKLTSVKLPEKITRIGKSAFRGCDSLESIEIPAGVTKIDSDVFFECSSLYEVILPESVNELQARVFYGCSGLRSVVLSPNITAIEASTFNKCSALESIVIPSGVETIGFEAFRDCSNMNVAVIPSSVMEIKPDSFFACDKLTIYAEKDSIAMYFADNVNHHVNGIPVKHATVPVSENPAGWVYMEQDEEVEIVGYNGTLAEIEIPDKINGKPVTSIAGRIFKEKAIISLTLSDSVTSIGDDICNGCTSLNHLILSDQLSTIGDNAFEGCTSLEEVIIPSKVTYVGSYAFAGCSKLTSASFAEGDTVGDIEIGFYAFQDCDLQDFVVPAGVKDILEHTFYGNNNMKSIVLLEGIEWIDTSAFTNCEKLTIYTTAGTVAEAYAKKYDIPVVFIDGSGGNTGGTTGGSGGNTGGTTGGSGGNTGGTTGGSGGNTGGTTTKEPAKTVKAPSVAKVKSFKATAKKKALKLRWKKVSGAAGYQIHISTKKNFKGAKKITVKKKKITYTASKLKSKKKYYVRIRAYKSYKDANGKSHKVYGKWKKISKKTK